MHRFHHVRLAILTVTILFFMRFTREALRAIRSVGVPGSIIDPRLIAPFVASATLLVLVATLVRLKPRLSSAAGGGLTITVALLFAASQYALIAHPPELLIVTALGMAVLSPGRSRPAVYISQALLAVVGGFAAASPSTALLVVGTGASTAIVAHLAHVAEVEWANRQSLFEQAEWAVSRYSSANLRLQEDVMRTEIWSRNRERTRVAREVHDTVGHTLTATLMQVSAVRKMLGEPRASLDSRLENLERMIRVAIQDVRREVDALRRERSLGDDWRASYLALCKAYSESTGIRVHRVIEDEIERLSDTLGENVYRILQESVTNAFRHGGASYIDVAMGKHGDQLYLRISDNGRGSEAAVPGNGLRGMRERVDEMGGSITWQTYPGRGFDIAVAVPWKEREV